MSVRCGPGRRALGVVVALGVTWPLLASAGKDEPLTLPAAGPLPAAATSASASPPTASSSDVPLQAMLGPFPTVESFCAGMAAERPARRCAAAPNTWDSGDRRGARGPFRSARLVRTTGKRGPNEVQFCRVAAQTERGWYVSAEDAPCEGVVRGATVSTRTDRFRWADEIGPGILVVRASHEDEVVIDQRRWWGAMEASFTDSRTSSMFCGMGTDGVPRCSPPLVEGCSAGNAWDGGLRIVSGKLVVENSKAEEVGCVGVVLTQGSHELALRGAEPGPRAWVPSEDGGGGEDGDGSDSRLTAIPAYGPFTSTQHYCADLPDFGVWPVEDGSSQDDSAPAKRRPRPEACAPGAAWAGSLGGRGPLGGVALMRVRNNMAGATIHHCRVAMKTAQGWFVTTGYETCEGVIGPGADIDTRARPLQWIGTQDQPVVLVDATYWHAFASYGERYDEIDLGPPAARPARSRPPRIVYQVPRKRRVRLCGVGRSGIPSCTLWVDAGCITARGRPTHDVLWHSGTLELKQRGALAEDEQSECEVERASWTVTLP